MMPMKTIDRDLLQRLSAQAADSGRRRANYNFHPAPADGVQRFCNAVEPGSYVRPHRHPAAGRWEFVLALAGAAALLSFDDHGQVRERLLLSPDGAYRGAEIPGGTWHTLAALEPGTVLFEFKPGPYSPTADKDFAAWAPPEGDAACPRFEQWFTSARIGDRIPPLG